MDQIDRQIIACLEENARMPLKKIAEKCFISPSVASTRLQRLEAQELITGYRVVLNHKTIGFPIKAFISLELNPSQKKEFYPFIEQFNHVLACDCVTGPYAMLIQVVSASTDELDHFIGLLQAFGKTYTQIVFSTQIEYRPPQF